MYALTLHREWAHAVAHLGKRIENRTWLPPVHVIGQRIAIHAGKARHARAVAEIRAMGYEMPDDVMGSAVVCTAVVAGYLHGDNPSRTGCWCVGCLRAMSVKADDPWFCGPVGWVLRDVRPIDPAPMPGRLGLWKVPERLVRAYRLDEVR